MRPESIEAGGGGHVSSLFSSPLNFLTISYFGFKKKKRRFRTGASPSLPVTGAQPSPPHGPPGLHGTQAFELSPACPREAPLAGTRLPWAGTWKPWEQLHLQSTWIPTLMLFCLWERTFEETSGRLSSPSPPSLGRRALALHGPTALSRLGFPRIPW